MRPRPVSLLAAASACMILSTPCGAALSARTDGSRPAPLPASSIFDHDDRMDVNSLDMVVSNHGSFAYDLLTGNAGLVYPRGSGKSAVFAAGLWVGAKVNGATRLAVADYAYEFVPGPMSNGSFLPDQPDFRNYRIVRGNTTSPDYLSWPAWQGAPLDALGAPLLSGDATLWSVYNDADPSLHLFPWAGTAPLGIEVQQTVYAFDRPGPWANIIFVKWKLSNKGGSLLESTYVSAWCDPDLGGATDDLAGCDSTLDLGYAYNATNSDLQYGSAPPAVGIHLLRGPVVAMEPGVYDTLGMTSFYAYINGMDPQHFEETYNLMRGLTPSGDAIHVLNDPSLPATAFTFSGLNPGTPGGPLNWVDASPADKRFLLSSGPFRMAPGDVQEVVIAICVGQGTDRLSSIAELRQVVLAAGTSPPEPPSTLSTGVDIDPYTVKLANHAPWLTAYIEPSKFDAASIDVSTVRLAGTVAAESRSVALGDHDGDGRPELSLKFARSAVDPLLVPGINRLEITGTLTTGQRFAGSDEVRVLDLAANPLAASVAPNPLNPSGTLRFETGRPGPVRVRIYDVQGRPVRTLIDSPWMPAGPHEVRIDGRGSAGNGLGSGVYLFRIETEEGRSTGRVVVLK